MKQSTNRTILISSIALVLINGLFLLVLWKTGFLTFTGSDPSSKIVAAAIALVGEFIGSIVTILGLLMKHSIDIHAEQRLTLETDRNAILQREAESRLKLEAAIRAIQLLATNSGKASPSIQCAGALYSLISLGQNELSLSLVFNLLSRKEIEADTAGDLINQVLHSCNQETQNQAINGIVDYVDSFITPIGIALPQIIMNGTSTFSTYAREWIPIVLGRTMAGRPLSEWRKMEEQAYGIIAALCLAWEDEKEELTKRSIGEILVPILKGFPEVGIMTHPQKQINANEIRNEISKLSNNSALTSSTYPVVNQLNRWLNKASPMRRRGNKRTRTK
jgi:hypothetical protein